MEPELNRQASSNTPEWPHQAAPVFADDDTYLDSEQITTPRPPASPQQQPIPNQQLDKQLGEQRERQLEQQLSQARNELAAMESLMAEVSEIFELKYKQRLQPILEENNGLRQQLDQVHRQLHQLKPQQRQAQPEQPQLPQVARNQQPQLPQVERPQRQQSQRQRPQLQPARSTATQAPRSKANIASTSTINPRGEKPSALNADKRKEVPEETNSKKSGGKNQSVENLDRENLVTARGGRPRRNRRIRPVQRIIQILRTGWLKLIQSIRWIRSISRIGWLTLLRQIKRIRLIQRIRQISLPRRIKRLRLLKRVRLLRPIKQLKPLGRNKQIRSLQQTKQGELLRLAKRASSISLKKLKKLSRRISHSSLISLSKLIGRIGLIVRVKPMDLIGRIKKIRKKGN